MDAPPVLAPEGREAGLRPGSGREVAGAGEVFKAKVVLVGPPRAGKTALVRRYVLDAFDERYARTLGANVYKWTAPLDVGGSPVRVTITFVDTTGEPGSLSSLRDLCLCGAQGVLAVTDATGSSPGPSPAVESALRLTGDVPVHVLLNKADLGPSEEAIAAGLADAKGRAAPCWLTSAKTGDNVREAFTDLARRIVGRSIAPPEGPLDDADFGLAMACARPRTPQDLARGREMPLPVVDARLERLRRQGYVHVVSVSLDDAGRPRIAYAASQAAFLEPLRAARG